MPRPTRKPLIQCRYYSWLLGRRKGIYFADGRGNRPHDVGRHSLGTRDRQEALAALDRLDEAAAIKHGLIEKPVATPDSGRPLDIEAGIELYQAHVDRPPVMGGVSQSTAQRYGAVIDKFLNYCQTHGANTWQKVTNALVNSYGKYLEHENYHGSTIGFEINQIKCMVNFLVAEGFLPASARLKIKVKKATSTTRYCFSKAEVQGILELCRQRESLDWFGDLATVLAFTGMRISELANLKWTDVDLERRSIRLADHSRSSRLADRDSASTTKSHRPREIGIHHLVLAVLESQPRHRDGFVFHGPKGGRVKPDTVLNVLKRNVLPPLAERFPKTAHRQGILAGKIHSFRHFFCSLCAEGNVPEQKLKSLLGHSSSLMIRHYYHPDHAETLKQIDALSLQSDVTEDVSQIAT